MKKSTIVAVTASFLAIFSSQSIFAQSDNNTPDKNSTTYVPVERKFTITQDGLVRNYTDKDNNSSQLVVFRPDVLFKAKYDLQTSNGTQRFSVRNASVGFSGAMNKKVKYRFLADLVSDASICVLDLYVNYRPTERFAVTFGQHCLPLFNAYTNSPACIDFANRPFIGKFFNSSRDIGLTAEYKIKKEGFPITIEAGIYNGMDINTSKWSQTPAYSARLTFGSLNEGFRVTAKGLRIKLSEQQDNYLAGGDIRYLKNGLKVETEVMYRHNEYDGTDLLSYYAQLFYCFNVNQSSWLKGIEPAARWEQIGEEVSSDGFGFNRLTAGVNFNLKTGLFKTVFRINYEHMFNNKDLLTITQPIDHENKLTAEIFFMF